LREGVARRLQLSVRATMHINYCLNSLRTPWDPSQTLLHARDEGTLFRPATLQCLFAHLQRILADTSTANATTHYHAAIALDISLPHVLYVPPPASSAPTEIEPLYSIFQDSLPDYSSALHDVLFSQDTVTKSPQHHIICKLLPRAANVRGFVSILARKCAANPAFGRGITEIIACGLLGNYRHCCSTTRASPAFRVLVYRALFPRTLCANPHRRLATGHIREILLMRRLPELQLFALREYMCSLVDESAITRKHANALFAYETFRTTVLTLMGAVRVALMRAFARSTQHVKTESYKAEVAGLIDRAYEVVVENNYRKAATPALAQLRSAKGEVQPLLDWVNPATTTTWFCSNPTADEKCSITRSHTRKRKAERDTEAAAPKIQKTTASEEKEDDDDDAAFQQMLRAIETGEDEEGEAIPQDFHVVPRRVVNVNAVPPQPPGTLAITRDCIRVDHSKLVQYFCSLYDPDTNQMEILEHACVALSLLGASTRALQLHRELAKKMQTGKGTRIAWLTELRRLRAGYPYTYNLLQAVACTWHRYTDLRRYTLPHHYVVNQLRALAQLYSGGVPDERILSSEPDAIPKIVPMRPCFMAVCRVCLQIYSIVRRPERRRSKKAKPEEEEEKKTRRKTVTTHGYSEVSVDLATGHIYCTNEKTVAHESCSAQPLAQINMIGCEVYLKGSLYVLCPQPGCGQLAVLEMGSANYTSYGLMCHSCSLARESELLAATSGRVHATLQRLRRFNAKSSGAAAYRSRTTLTALELIADKGTKTVTATAAAAAAEEESEAEDEQKSHRKLCYLCGKRVIPSRMWIFGMDTFVCASHPIHSIIEHVYKGLHSYGFPVTVQIDDPKEPITRGLMLEYHEGWKAIQATKKVARAKADRKQAAKNAIVNQRLKR
jgi:hypothetical protein